jgi:hypothetical protein
MWKLPIKFHARISKEQIGKLSLISWKAEGAAIGTALVFNLTTSVMERRSEKVFEMISCLYENLLYEMKITNKFTSDADFSILITWPSNARSFQAN